MAKIERRRGTTKGDQIIVTSQLTGEVFPVTGCSFIMYVTTDKHPDTFGPTLLYQITGTILDGPTGSVEFVPTELQADQADGVYYYEVWMTGTDGRDVMVASDKYKYF